MKADQHISSVGGGAQFSEVSGESDDDYPNSGGNGESRARDDRDLTRVHSAGASHFVRERDV